MHEAGTGRRGRLIWNRLGKVGIAGRGTRQRVKHIGFAMVLMLCGNVAAEAQQSGDVSIEVNWNKVIGVSRSTPTLQVVVNPRIAHGGDLNAASFAALKQLGGDYVRYVPWLPYPRQAVAELEPPAEGKTSWDFSHIDPTLDDFMRAQKGHSVVLNFSTIPAWMWKTKAPVTYPDDPNKVFWGYTQGTEMRDRTFQEAADYFARLLSWYEKGGLTDEAGKWHESGHHYKFAYWEVLNEIDYEHNWSAENYTKFYDAVTAAMRRVDPELKFMAMGMGSPNGKAAFFEYFLNPANHAKGAPLDYITYHFYAHPAEEETMNEWQYTFFDQEQGFLNTVGFVEAIRKRLSPATKTDLNELGVILPEDEKENHHPGYVARPEPAGYWNLAGAMYADLYLQAARMGIEVVGESQLLGYRSQFPSVSMMNYQNGEENARFWVLKLLKDNFGPGDKLLATNVANGVSAQAFVTQGGRKLLLVNKRLRAVTVTLPKGFTAGHVMLVAPSTGDHAPMTNQVAGTSVTLEANEVAVVAE
jgi:Glycosyl hydrolases family 39